MNEVKEYSVEEFKQLIQDAYKDLPKNQKIIADFIVGDINEAAFLSVIEIGERCDVSKATVVRFAQRIGFEGYHEFKNALQIAVHKKFTFMNRLPLVAETDRDTIYKVARQDVENINQTMEHISIAEFDEIVSRLRSSRHIATFGIGISALMAQVLAYSLNQVAISAGTAVSGHLSFEEQLMFLNKEDTLVLFSFPPYSKETITAAELAKKKGISIVAITDNPESPVTKFSNYKLLIKSENLLFTNSFAAISVVINALTTEISIRDKKKTLNFIRNLNNLMNDSGHFC